MKKNFMMRAASVLLVAVMLTTCAISGTFAKYVTAETSTDSARVAKFGVKITANGKTFAEAYDDETNDVASTVVSSSYDLGVDATEDNVVAPGTSGSLAAMALEGTPEVDVRVSYKAVVEISDNWEEDIADDGNPEFYFPLIITINGTAYSAAGTGCADADAFEDYLEAKIAAYTKDYDAGKDLSTVGADSLAISWEWPFEVDANSDGVADVDVDKKDTYLGDEAAAGNAASISITVTTTVEQID